MTNPGASCRIERPVEWVDTDAAGIAHNSATMRWVEACEAQLMRDLELPEYFPTAPRVQQTINFTAPLSFGQTVVVELAVQSLGTSSITLAFTVVGAEFEGRPAVRSAHGTVTAVHVPLGESRSAPWPERIRTRLRPAHRAQSATQQETAVATA